MLKCTSKKVGLRALMLLVLLHFQSSPMVIFDLPVIFLTLLIASSSDKLELLSGCSAVCNGLIRAAKEINKQLFLASYPYMAVVATFVEIIYKKFFHNLKFFKCYLLVFIWYLFRRTYTEDRENL